MNIKSNRKAISPVLATVILIAITLIAAIAIAGFVFGLFSSFTSSARVTVTNSSLAHNAGGFTGSVTFSNTGTANAAINTITFTYGGQTCTASGQTYAPSATGVVAAGSQPGETATWAAPGGCVTATNSGQAFTGSASLSNGAQVPFTGIFS